MTLKTRIDFSDPHAPGAPRLRVAFGTPREVFVAHVLADVPVVLAQVQAAAQAGRWCVGAVAYEAAPAFDSALQTAQTPDKVNAGTEFAHAPLAWFAVHDAPQPWPQADSAYQSAPVLAWEPTLGRSAFDAALDEVASAIAAGAYYQVNFTAALRAPLDEGEASQDAHAGAWFDALQAAQPGGYAALLPMDGAWALSVSPELFFDWNSQTGAILTRPMKGTAARGASPIEDAQAAQTLCASPKERAENVMVVDLLRNDLSRIAQPASVQVPRLFHAEALPSVWQMTSDVRATTRPDVRLPDVFAALFPCGSVTGAPKAAAMQAIASLESAPRGIYCGALGVVRPGAQGGIHATFNVPIRTLELRGAWARCGIGSGLTSGSHPDAEWQEWQNKRAFLDRAGEPFELLETFALLEGSFQNADQHLDRMAAAAVHFGYPWNAHAVRGELQIASLQHMEGHWRVRLLASSEGGVRAQAFALHGMAGPVRLQLAERAFAEAHSDFVRHKTTRRAHYDAFAPTDGAVFDTILYNMQGEITECTRGNIAALVQGRWITPPLSCGLLPGVGRALALNEGRVQEAVLRLEDVGQVRGWAFVNSLRGWLAAKLVPKVSNAMTAADPAGTATL